MLFNESMSSYEARNRLYQAAAGKTKAEIDQIKTEYKAVAHKIYERELRESGDLVLTSDKNK